MVELPEEHYTGWLRNDGCARLVFETLTQKQLNEMSGERDTASQLFFINIRKLVKETTTSPNLYIRVAALEKLTLCTTIHEVPFSNTTEGYANDFANHHRDYRNFVWISFELLDHSLVMVPFIVNDKELLALNKAAKPTQTPEYLIPSQDDLESNYPQPPVPRNFRTITKNVVFKVLGKAYFSGCTLKEVGSSHLYFGRENIEADLSKGRFK